MDHFIYNISDDEGGEGSSTVDQVSGVEMREESRCFWRLGAFHFVQDKPAVSHDQGHELLEHARVHPKFLHSNASDHKWAFGAIAELIDNAVEEIPNGATYITIEKFTNPRDNSPGLLFRDDGGGMDPEGLRSCMSLGYSSKKANTTIGQYGNGFKTSTMRLGADAIVFSCATRESHSTQCIGLLSYTLLMKTGQQDVIIPMLDFELSGNKTQPIVYGSQHDWFTNLNLLLEWSPFASKEGLMAQFDDIGSHGTKVIIYNLWLEDNSLLELDFDKDNEDICLREAIDTRKLRARERLAQTHISSRLHFSLRAYASVLYLRKFENFRIILRGKLVEQYSIVEDLEFKTVITYRPHVGPEQVSIDTTIGFVREARTLKVTGFNLYHRNRLIKPFWSLVRAEASSRGRGVVGVLEANFIEPAHNKQDFERSDLFTRLENRLRQMTFEYWNCHNHLIGFESPASHRADRQKKGDSDELAVEHEQQETNDAYPVNDVPLNPVVVHEQQGTSVVPPVNDVPPYPDKLSNFQPMSARPPESFGRIPKAALLDQLKDENLKLFIRNEQSRLAQGEKKQKIEEMKRKIKEMKRKNSRISSHLEKQKEQKENATKE